MGLGFGDILVQLRGVGRCVVDLVGGTLCVDGGVGGPFGASGVADYLPHLVECFMGVVMIVLVRVSMVSSWLGHASLVPYPCP